MAYLWLVFRWSGFPDYEDVDVSVPAEFATFRRRSDPRIPLSKPIVGVRPTSQEVGAGKANISICDTPAQLSHEVYGGVFNTWLGFEAENHVRTNSTQMILEYRASLTLTGGDTNEQRNGQQDYRRSLVH